MVARLQILNRFSCYGSLQAQGGVTLCHVIGLSFLSFPHFAARARFAIGRIDRSCGKKKQTKNVRHAPRKVCLHPMLRHAIRSCSTN
ncbi:hypothetical protein TNCT_608501 [Trichonephila clavata]|uniref:Uncharacterized protein n=1 Tax=Trichonephila clavata TaxID=2740835 RepID=A0A8X6JH16_TRICU|nr:hypothetical protein TNCT_608501 [Trichonephila clavata]